MPLFICDTCGRNLEEASQTCNQCEKIEHLANMLMSAIFERDKLRGEVGRERQAILGAATTALAAMDAVKSGRRIVEGEDSVVRERLERIVSAVVEHVRKQKGGE